jgi:hypothetical protein
VTAPNPEQESSSSGAGRPSGRQPRRTDVVSYVHRDHLLGRDIPALGVVVEVGQVLTVRPLAGHYVQVDPADAAVVSADDVS